MTFKSLFFSSSSQQISFFTFLNISCLNHQLFLLIFAPIYSVFFWEFIKKRRDAHEKIFSIVLSTCKQVTKIAFSRSFLYSHRIFTSKGIFFYGKFTLRENLLTHWYIFLYFLFIFLSRKSFSAQLSLVKRGKNIFFYIFPQATAFFFQYKMFYINFIKLCTLYEIFQQIKKEWCIYTNMWYKMKTSVY